MSWRTKGKYLGLSNSDREYLGRFDRDWDTKSRGRSRTDAIDSAGRAKLFVGTALVSPDSDLRTLLEANFLMIARSIARFTVPKQKKSGWSIHVVMKCGKRARVHFDDLASAVHIYEELSEVSQWFQTS